METDEDHAQLVVEQHGVVRDRHVVTIAPPDDLLADGVFPILRQLLPAEHVERAMLRDLHEPGGRIGGNAIARPASERGQQRVLHDVLDELDVARAEDARQRGRHARGFVRRDGRPGREGQGKTAVWAGSLRRLRRD